MRRINLHITLILLIPILSSCAFIPVKDLSLSGQVIDGETGDPVESALVTIRATEIQTTTASEGFFELRVPDTA